MADVTVLVGIFCEILQLDTDSAPDSVLEMAVFEKLVPMATLFLAICSPLSAEWTPAI